MTALRLHDYGPSANCYKVRLLLAQLGLEYERVPVDIFGGDTLTDDYGKVNPVRQTPVLERDGHDPLPESGAILVHLAEGTEYLPEDPGERAQALRWLFFEQTEVIPGIAGLRFRVVTERIRPDGREAQWRRNTGNAALRVLNDRLDEERLPRRRELLHRGHLPLCLCARGKRGRVRAERVPGGQGLAGQSRGNRGLHERPRALPAECPAGREPFDLRLRIELCSLRCNASPYRCRTNRRAS